MWEQRGEYVKRLLRKWTTAPPEMIAPLLRHEVDDLHHEVFLKLLKPRAPFDGRSKVTTWLYRVLHNAVASYQRHQGRMRGRERGWAEAAYPHHRPLGRGKPARGSADDDAHVHEPVELPWRELPVADASEDDRGQPDTDSDSAHQHVDPVDDEQGARKLARRRRQDARERDQRGRYDSLYQEQLQEVVIGSDDQGLVQRDAVQADENQTAAEVLIKTLDPRLVRVARLMAEDGLTQEQAAGKKGLTAKTFRNLAHAEAKRLGIQPNRRRPQRRPARALP